MFEDCGGGGGDVVTRVHKQGADELNSLELYLSEVSSTEA